MSWQPIETAPKTEALEKILVGSFPKGAVAMVRWPMWSHDKEHFTMMSGDYFAPTHWMPLPNPPEDL